MEILLWLRDKLSNFEWNSRLRRYGLIIIEMVKEFIKVWRMFYDVRIESTKIGENV